jgi:hypothetical protein
VTENLNRLLDATLAALPSHLRDKIVIFGSAPLVFAGLHADVTTDLDLFVSDETFDAIAKAGFAPDEVKPGIPRIVLADKVEVYKTWLEVAFPEVDAAAAPCEGSRGLRVASLAHVLAYKLVCGREKDREDIAALKQRLSK